MKNKRDEKYRKDDLIGIRKARFASFVLLLTCFAGMLVILVLLGDGRQGYIAAAILIVVLAICWWVVYRRILYAEADFFEALANDFRSVNRRHRILESAVRQIGDGVVVVTEDRDLILVNETAKKFLGVVDDDLDGMLYDEHAAGFSEKLVRGAILEAAKENRPVDTIEVNERTYKVGYVSIEAEKGWGRGAVAVISDVTERTNVEKMQTDFVANVSHELKTPLTAIRLYTETLYDGVEDEEKAVGFLSSILTQAERMAQMIKGNLLLARAEHVGMSIETVEEDLTKIVKNSMEMLRKEAEKKSHTLNQMFSDDRIPAEIQRDLIEHLMQNILGNAIKYTEEKGRIDVDIIQGQNCVQIVISDNGAGIPEEDLPRVFERYYIADKSRTENMGGTGLGLAISKKIVDIHEGTISIDSKVGRGTTVTVSLPAGRYRGVPGIL